MSERPLSEKLRIRENSKVLLLNPPKDYERILHKLPKGTKLLASATGPVDVGQLFVSSKKELQQRLPELKPVLTESSVLWVTYPKGTSGVNADVNRDSIREYAKSIGLEAVALVSVDNVWSALRLKLA